MHNDAAAEALERCGASSENGLYRCELTAGHPGPHSSVGAPGRPGVSWPRELSRSELPELYKAPPWARHTFPHRKIAYKVVRASRRYRCDRVAGRPPGHRMTVEPGEQYVRVSLRPESGSAGWRSRTLCRACALDYGLATEDPPPTNGGSS